MPADASRSFGDRSRSPARCPPTFPFHQRPLLLDGGLATWLETGYHKDLSHKLWSSKVLQEEPKVVEDAHFDFLTKGDCDMIITCTYQSSLEHGFEGNRANFEASVQAACEVAARAKARALRERGSAAEGRPILVAGSCGSYGAALADGSEYSGKFGFERKSEEEIFGTLKEFHQPRMELLAGNVDVLAAETIPLAIEGRVVSTMFKSLRTPGYVTFSCKNDVDLCSGEKIREAVRNLELSEFLVGVGVNCTPPQYVEGLIAEIKAGIEENVSALAEDNKRAINIVVYPNSGEIYCGQTKTWKPDPALNSRSFSEMALCWRKAGARWIGGCCRTVPTDIKRVREHAMQE